MSALGVQFAPLVHWNDFKVIKWVPNFCKPWNLMPCPSVLSHLDHLVAISDLLIQLGNMKSVAHFSSVDLPSEHMQLKRGRLGRLSGYVIPLVCCGSLFECLCTRVRLIDRLAVFFFFFFWVGMGSLLVFEFLSFKVVFSDLKAASPKEFKHIVLWDLFFPLHGFD